MSLLNRLQPCIAAEAQAGNTHYQDDQSWELALGQGEQPGAALQTRYGGRVGLARLVPVFQIGEQRVYEAQAFAKPFQLTALTSNALQLDAEIVPGVKARLFAWVIASQVLGGYMQINNSTGQPISGRVELYAQAMRDQTDSLKMSFLHLQGNEVALALGKVTALEPVLLLEKGEGTTATRLSAPLTIAAGKSQVVKFVHAGYANMEKSLEVAYHWLQQDWTAALTAINQRHKTIPAIDTGDDQLDAAIMLSQQAALRSWIGAKPHLPFPAPIFTRVPDYGYQPDHLRGWDGQTAFDMFQLGTAIITLDPNLAKGLVRNYLAVQHPDGWIDAAPGAAGQRQGQLCPPVLAQLTALIYRHTDDQAFVNEVYGALLRFYARWFAPDMDTDGDGFPEWQHHQFSLLQDIDMRLVEAPDLASFLLNEGTALASLANGQRKTAWGKVKKLHTRLAEELQKSWDGAYFAYRDRDVTNTGAGQVLFKGKGDTRLATPLALEKPQRLVIRPEGGVDHRPKLKATIRGLDYQGRPATEVIENPSFSWYRSAGMATTRTVWQRVDEVWVEGLSRVYEVVISTVDLTQEDITLLLPYTTPAITTEQAEVLLDHLKHTYLKKSGLAALPDARREEAQRVLLPYVSMIGLALLQRGEVKASLQLFERVTAAMEKTLVEQGGFFQWYHADTGAGMGLADHVTGIVPLYWLMNLLGVTVRDSKTVEILGVSAFKRKVQIAQHGVKITRSSRLTAIKFPSGQTVELPADAPPQIITDPTLPPKKSKA